MGTYTFARLSYLMIATSTVCATASPPESLNVVLPTVPHLVTRLKSGFRGPLSIGTQKGPPGIQKGPLSLRLMRKAPGSNKAGDRISRGDPSQCRFNPSGPTCRGVENDSCLTTGAQVTTLKKIYSGTRNGSGQILRTRRDRHGKTAALIKWPQIASVVSR
jgi:hypothetical protein